MKIIWIILPILLMSIFAGCLEKQPVIEPSATPTPSQTTFEVTPAPVQTPEYTYYPVSPVRYRSWIDGDYGFYKLRAIKDNTSYLLPLDLDTRNFTINVGDTVRWINDDMYDYSMTLVSNESLWTGSTAYLRYQGQLFEYTFSKPGVYTFHVKEFPKIAPQRITVK